MVRKALFFTSRCSPTLTYSLQPLIAKTATALSRIHSSKPQPSLSLRISESSLNFFISSFAIEFRILFFTISAFFG
ncbi:hypothetical protein SLEP1_g10171 [Rubroshorea leprosula]|uniref:Uncharacterized protein n=1 Tax=Rubroshorea leprosula TaxID=152421 RepID=A0AAV5IFS9_9ROSI|nr:hypothetical protein SLEP1_g10171 [Rubroshorea leprosula]